MESEGREGIELIETGWRELKEWKKASVSQADFLQFSNQIKVLGKV